MNVAFPALFSFLLVLPGIIFRYSYARGSWGWESPTSVRRFSDEVAYGVVFSLPLHAGWIWLATRLGQPPDLASALRILVGNFGPNSQLLTESVRSVADHQLLVSWYFLSLYAVSAALGTLLHWAVRRMRLDHRLGMLRFENYWFYMLTGEVLRFGPQPVDDQEVDGVYLSAVVNHGPTSYLYRGIVEDFTFDAGGSLESVVLSDAHRRRLDNDRVVGAQASGAVASPPSDDPRYYEIRGDFLILRYAEMQTLNLEYFFLESAA